MCGACHRARIRATRWLLRPTGAAGNRGAIERHLGSGAQPSAPNDEQPVLLMDEPRLVLVPSSDRPPGRDECEPVQLRAERAASSA